MAMKNKLSKKSGTESGLLELSDLPYETQCLNFVLKGIACHALCLLKESGVLDELLNQEAVNIAKICGNFKNSSLMRSALVTLVHAKVVVHTNGDLKLTEFGRRMAESIGLLTVPLTGYRRLFANQYELLNYPERFNCESIDFERVAWASKDFGKQELDQALKDVIKKINPRGTICDLGCGSGLKLQELCLLTNLPGLGIDLSDKVISEAVRTLPKHIDIEFVQGNISDLEGVWEDVDVALASYVFHDIIPNEECVKMLSSLRTTFPRLRSLIIVDIVASSLEDQDIMPGFDYVHGLQGVMPRTYSETMSCFSKAQYSIVEKFSVHNMPNTYIWILRPNQ